MWKVGGSLLGLRALLLVTADVSRDDFSYVIIFVIRTVRTRAVFMNAMNVGHGSRGMVAALESEQIRQEASQVS